MANYFRSEDLITKGKQSYNENFFRYSQKAEMDKSSFDIFLSHNNRDRREVQGLYDKLTEMGYKVYVSWIVDPEFDGKPVTKEISSTIRERMNISKCVIVVTSNNSPLSSWMPWELGFLDGQKKKAALLPIIESDNQSYRRQEYLELYPQVVENKVGDKAEVMLLNTTITVRQWINQ